MVEPGKPALAALVERFGPGILAADGRARPPGAGGGRLRRRRGPPGPRRHHLAGDRRGDRAPDPGSARRRESSCATSRCSWRAKAAASRPYVAVVVVEAPLRRAPRPARAARGVARDDAERAHGRAGDRRAAPGGRHPRRRQRRRPRRARGPGRRRVGRPRAPARHRRRRHHRVRREPRIASYPAVSIAGDAAPSSSSPICRPRATSPPPSTRSAAGHRTGRPLPDPARHHRVGQELHHRAVSSSRCSGPRWCSRPTRPSPRSWPASSGSCSRRTGSSTSSRTTTTTSPRRTCRPPTPTSRRTRRSTTRSTGCATRPRAR